MAGATYTHIDNDDDDDAPIPAALECPICRSAFDNPVMLLPCAHLFCRACLQASLDVAPLCPLDRLPVAVAPQTDSVLQPAPRNIQQLLDALPTAAHCDECGWRGRRDAAQHHLCTTAPGPAEGSSSSSSSSKADPTSATTLHPCPQSTRGCSVRLTQTDLQAHLSFCPFVALSAYFDLQDDRATALHNQLTQLSHQVSALDRRLTQHAADAQDGLERLQAHTEATQARGQIAALDESLHIAHEFTGLRAGLDGVRRQLFGLLVEREARIGPHRPPFVAPSPYQPQPAAHSAAPPQAQQREGTKL